MKTEPIKPPLRRNWPWLLLAAIVLGALLAILWLSLEVRRLKERRQYYIPSEATNSPPARTNTP